jgi:hypothetical protein
VLVTIRGAFVVQEPATTAYVVRNIVTLSTARNSYQNTVLISHLKHFCALCQQIDQSLGKSFNFLLL